MLVGGHFNTSLPLVSTTKLTTAKLSGFAGLFFQSIGAFKNAIDRLENHGSGARNGDLYEKMLSYRNIISGASKPVVITEQIHGFMNKKSAAADVFILIDRFHAYID